MNKDVLNEREFELVNIIGRKLGSNQRDLSRHMDLSLGMVNMLIRRLIAKGFIRINQLNKRKVEYILTPKGFAEKMRKSIKYTLNTINSIGLIKERVKGVVARSYAQGERNFVILGQSDFSILIELVFKDLGLSDYQLTYTEELPDDELHGTLLICKEKVSVPATSSMTVINLVQELAMDFDLVQLAGRNGEVAYVKA